jgi:hypothetical protein
MQRPNNKSRSTTVSKAPIFGNTTATTTSSSPPPTAVTALSPDTAS